MAIEHDPQSREELTRILGLPVSASDEAIQQAAERLLGSLRRRRHAASLAASANPSGGDRGGSSGLEGAGPHTSPELTTEIEGLERAAARFAGWVPLGRRRKSGRSAERDRWSLVAAMLAVALVLALMIAYASGMRVVTKDQTPARVAARAPAKLMLFGELRGATLRVLDADRAEVFAVLPAAGAIVELAEGRYAIEVTKEGCTDAWTRSTYFDAGSIHRYTPQVCEGEGSVTIRSNVTGDRLLIDGVEAGSTGPEPRTLAVGEHEIRIEKDGYAAFESVVQVTPDSELEVRAELRAEAAPGGEPRPALPSGLSAPDLSTHALPKPAPFDLGALQQELAPPKSASASTRLLSRRSGDRLPDGGSTAWHDRVSRELLSRFDRDGSGSIDRLDESDSISCPLWLEIERDFDRGGLGLSMARYFGFDGSEWHARALGFARGMRGAAYSKMKECGLQS